ERIVASSRPANPAPRIRIRASTRRAYPGHARRRPGGCRSGDAVVRVPLAGGDGEGQPVGGRRGRGRPGRVVAGRRGVGEGEVQHQGRGIPVEAEIGALDRVDEVAPAAVGGVAGRVVLEREEEPAAVALVPGQLELVLRSVELEAHEANAGERERAARADRDLAYTRVDALDPSD